jgi:hypothetical protein
MVKRYKGTLTTAERMELEKYPKKGNIHTEKPVRRLAVLKQMRLRISFTHTKL